LTQCGSSPRTTQRAIDWKAFDRLAICFIVIFSFISFEFLLDEVHAHAPVPQTPAAHFSASNGAEQSRQNDTPENTPKPSGDQAIPLAKIADRAEDLDRLLREISNQFTPKSELIESERKTAEHAEEIRRRALQTRELLVGTPTPLELEDEQRYWRSRNLEYGAERRLLTLRAAKLVEQIQILAAQQPEWLATWIRIRESPGIESVVERTKEQLDKIYAAKSLAQEQLNIVLKLQNDVAQQDQQISAILLQVREARNGEPSRLLEPNSLPLWNARQLRQLDQSAGPVFHGSFDRSFTTAMEFLRTRKFAMLSLVVSYLLALLAVFKLSRYAARGTPLEVTSEASHLLGRPFSVALLLTLIGTVKFVASIPIGLAFVFCLVYLIPVLRILAPLVDPRARIFLYVQATLYGLEGVYLSVQLPPLLRRELYAVLVLIALISLVWLVRRSKMLQASVPRPGQRMLVIGIRGALLLLAGSLLANIIGFVSLSQVLGLTALVGPFVASALYCGARVLALILGVVLRTHCARAVLNLRVDAIELWGSRLFMLGASLFWLKLMLQLVTFYDSAIEVSTKVLRHPIGFEKVHFTLGDALGVPLILLGGYFVASAFTFLLKNVVLSKLPLQRGVPYAISTITYYVLLLLVVLAALAGAGIELNKFSVLTGALGVGLGFGLQNIVNNFVSGLILLVERPIHVGDTVDVGGLVGIVRRIGARSSTVVTFQGAEVIVPNSNLLSNQVINWTLSSQWRRVDVPVRVAYGTDPERVIKLLVGVAESYPGVLLDRPPMAFFMGFGESSLNFELRFWSAWHDTWFQLQSDVTVAVAKALREAGIEIPFPQRDLHLRSIDASMAENALEKGIRTTSTDDSPERNAVR
jgi:potassium-dependent mechanosensitive channel